MKAGEKTGMVVERWLGSLGEERSRRSGKQTAAFCHALAFGETVSKMSALKGI